MKILVVDDVAFNRSFLKKALAKAGYDIYLAEDGIAALALIRQHDFPLIITDYMMPSMDGVGLYEQCQNLPKYKNMGVLLLPLFILMTATKDAKELKAMKQTSGFFDVFDAPLDMPELLKKIKQVETGEYLREEEVTTLNILVVDPFEETYKLTQSLVSSGKHQIKRAKTAEEAQDIFLADSQISLIICEFGLADTNGMELFERFKAIERFNDEGFVSKPDFVLITEPLDEGKVKVKDIQDSGLKDILIKPFPVEWLEEKIVTVYKRLSRAPKAERPESPKVLVVDDLGFNRAFLEKMVKRNGRETEVVTSGAEALTSIRNDPTIRLVIVDLMMPEMDGMELFKAATADDFKLSHPLPSFVLVTASNDFQKLEQAESLGFKEVFRKPVNSEKFKRCLNRLMPLSVPEAEVVKIDPAELDKPGEPRTSIGS